LFIKKLVLQLLNGVFGLLGEGLVERKGLLLGLVEWLAKEG